MNIEIWYDLVCPWCYLGKRRLESVLVDFAGEVTMTFRAYQLDPAPVPAPLPIKQAMATKVGGPEVAEQMLAHVTAIARGEGLAIDYHRAIAANTFDAHRLVSWAAAQELQLNMIETLQRAHFVEGVDLGSAAELARLAGSIGLDEQAALAYLATPAGTDSVNADLAEARELDITSVPTFVIDRKYVIQGAQEPAALRSALEEIARREAVDAAR
ncbi:disulfide bond formation protein DsbA [Actinoplanes sp. ATCC 53533]|uniref:DsbA family oxidoreductase n=1 Tax=Actinoplanes sp. ATCC 53533 TaxID=1288362 RepID=UPI000F7B4980|nr:DsbA family oxidoreductase [Actinoplanes sp. ATCC 53533]RSM44140.1 disulfide bond formation protein DsbA [Actinoplanes sp. ATCC 53533]